MMCEIMMSINPEHVENIMAGRKIYEFRKRACKKKVDRIIIYSTVPVKQVVGEAEVEEVLVGEPEKIWELTKNQAGIDRVFFDSYFYGRKEAVAYKLCNVKKYGKPLALKDFGVNCAPQSYQYVAEG